MIDINNFDAIEIGLASSKQIRGWSSGEVTKPETINYRTLKPEKDGLFCERIFGPTKDWECYCGKYKRVRYKGIVCEGFGDEDHLWAEHLDIDVAKLEDDERTKHIKDMRKSLEADRTDTEAYIEDAMERLRQVWDLFQEMTPKQVVNDETLFRELKERFGSPYGWGEYFRGGMGAESVRDLLLQVDLDAEREILEDQIKTAKGQKQQRAVKRLKVVSAFMKTDREGRRINSPDMMILEAVPVIPPELRPMVQLDGGRFATSDLNDLYRRVINRNNR